VDDRGFEIPDLFVVGYGIDWAEHCRHLIPDEQFIAVLQLFTASAQVLSTRCNQSSGFAFDRSRCSPKRKDLLDG